MKPPREQISFKLTEEEIELHNFFLQESSKYGKSEYIKLLIKRDKKRKEKSKNEKGIH